MRSRLYRRSTSSLACKKLCPERLLTSSQKVLIKFLPSKTRNSLLSGDRSFECGRSRFATIHEMSSRKIYDCYMVEIKIKVCFSEFFNQDFFMSCRMILKRLKWISPSAFIKQNALQIQNAL